MAQEPKKRHDVQAVWRKVDDLNNLYSKNEARMTAIEGKFDALEAKVESGFMANQSLLSATSRAVERLSANIDEMRKPTDMRAFWTAGVATIGLLIAILGAVVAPLYKDISINRAYMVRDVQDRLGVESRIAKLEAARDINIPRIEAMERRMYSEGFTQHDGNVLRDEISRLRQMIESHQLVDRSEKD